MDGESYYFISDEEFARRQAAGDFLESAELFGNHYGTPRGAVEQKLAEGRDVLLEIDVQGAKQIKASFPEARLIFIEPPSREVLLERLRDRGTETDEQVAQRTARAEEEMAHAAEYDLQVVNQDVDQAVADIETYLKNITS